MRKSTTPKGVAPLTCIVTQGRLRCTCQPCAFESITPMGYGHTAWFGAIECTMGNGTPCGLMEMGRGGACVTARVAPQGRTHRSIPRTQCAYFLIWKRRCADVRAGTQAPPLRFRLGRLRVERLMSFGQIACGTVDFVWVDCVCDFICWENGAHEPTPSVLYF